MKKGFDLIMFAYAKSGAAESLGPLDKKDLEATLNYLGKMSAKEIVEVLLEE